MRCPAGCFDGMIGYDRRERVVACRKCRGTGVVRPVEPQRPAPPPTFDGLIP